MRLVKLVTGISELLAEVVETMCAQSGGEGREDADEDGGGEEGRGGARLRGKEISLILNVMAKTR